MRSGMFLKYCFCFTLLACLLPAPKARAQNFSGRSWEKEFEWRDYDIPGIIIPAEGGFLLGGITRDNYNLVPRKGNDLLLIKLDERGNQLWKKYYGGFDDEYFAALQPTADGNYLIGGTSASDKSGNKSQNSEGADFWLVKVDKNGTIIWDKSIGGTGYDRLREIKQTADGGIILIGISNSGIGAGRSRESPGRDDFWIVKLDANGNKLWDIAFDKDVNTATPFLMQLTADGGFVLGNSVPVNPAYTGSFAQDYDYHLEKFDADGKLQWQKNVGGNRYEYLGFLQLANDGGYLLTGYSNSGAGKEKTKAAKGEGDIWLIKLDGNGNKLWDKVLASKLYDRAIDVNPTSDGGFAILGNSSRTRLGRKISVSGRCGEVRLIRQQIDVGKGTWLIKLDAHGEKQWERTFGSKNKWLASMQQNANNDFVFLGNLKNKGRNLDDLYLITLNAKGKNCRQEKVDIGAHFPQYSYSMRLAPDGCHIIEGKAGIGSDFPTDYLVIKHPSRK